MISKKHLNPICPKQIKANPVADHVANGLPMPPQSRIRTFDPDTWEEFTAEWVNSMEGYEQIGTIGGAGDQGLDVIGCVDDRGVFGIWDNYQCKRYGASLSPSDIWVEIGKIIYYSFKKEYTIPRKYYFVASQGIGSSLNKLLSSPEEFKKQAKENWEKYCSEKITKTEQIPLNGELLKWFNEFDFSIFSHKTILEILDLHRKTPYYSIRFGGGFPLRPKAEIPESNIQEEQSLYIQQVFKAYGEKTQRNIRNIEDLSPDLKTNFSRQRSYFYHAESLKNFARDTVYAGTFERLKDEVYDGVIEVSEDDHDNGFSRMNETLKRAANISIHSNPLKEVLEIADKKGICHHLTNENRLAWVFSEEVESNESSF